MSTRLRDRVAAVRTVGTLAIAVGALAGLIEAMLHAIRFRWADQFTWTGPDVIWMAPLSYVAFLGVLAVPVAMVAMLRPQWATAAVYLGVATAVASFGLLRVASAQRLHVAAMAAVAVGVGTQLGRWAYQRSSRVGPLAVRLAAGTTAFVAVVAALAMGWPRWRESAAIRALPPAPPAAPNVLLLVLDTVRGESLSLYGYGRPTSPELERFAAKGTRFEWAISASPWTLPSHASLFTGQPPWQTRASFRSRLDDRFETVAERFRARGYLTGGFVANTIYANVETGLSRGFIRYQDYRRSLRQILLSSEIGQLVSSQRSRMAIRAAHRPSAAVINERFREWLGQSERTGRPFFAFLNYMEAHLPYQTPEGWVERFRAGHPEVDRYDAAVGFLDEQIGRLLRELESSGVLENTIVVITSDHGEHLGDHGMSDHANSLYLQLLRVPLLVVHPRSVPAGKVVAEPVGLMDLMPTLATMAGIGGADSARSWSRYWQSEGPTTEPALIVSQVDQHPLQRSWDRNAKGPLWGILGQGLHLIENPDRSVELYDYRRDPEERMSRHADPVVASRLTDLRAVLDRTRLDGGRQ
ncbi:MAG: sulfatase [Gemmatimonadales bacterium]|nr:sulfatase [Gemmatimonadales bacterium]